MYLWYCGHCCCGSRYWADEERCLSSGHAHLDHHVQSWLVCRYWRFCSLWFYKGQGKTTKANAYFSLSICLGALLGVACWESMVIFEESLLRFFGADETLLTLAKAYMLPVLVVIPAYPFTQLLAAFCVMIVFQNLLLWQCWLVVHLILLATFFLYLA